MLYHTESQKSAANTDPGFRQTAGYRVETMHPTSLPYAPARQSATTRHSYSVFISTDAVFFSDSVGKLGR